MIHTPVLLKEVIEGLDPKPGQNFIDGTVGEGGHAIAILEKTSPDGKLLGIDWDADQVGHAKIATAAFAGRIALVNDSYANVADVAIREKFAPVHGILVDLGMSSWHLEAGSKGFSFKKDEPLDMRYNSEAPLTAEKIINEYSALRLEQIIEEYGEERFAKRIAGAIVRQREREPIRSTLALVHIIEEAMPGFAKTGRIHPATRTFQALRIEVNGELENVNNFLPRALELLQPGGRLAVISFHSLEDRLVKHFFQEAKKAGLADILTKKPIAAGEQEMAHNPRSRSAKLRILIKH